MRGRPIYVETTIAADMERVWAATQDPDSHVRWDVRFTRIVPRFVTDAGAQVFTYTRATPFHTIRGEGVSLGERHRPDGTRTSALRFSTRDRLSPLRDGRGYWRYVPVGPEAADGSDETGVRFVTGYDYSPGWGPLDLVVRPLVGWATAWSFDRLRIWLETGVAPEEWPLWSVLWFWRRGRPRAARCRRTPPHDRGRGHRLAEAPETLAGLPRPDALTGNPT